MESFVALPLVQLSRTSSAEPASRPDAPARKPSWLKVQAPGGDNYLRIRGMMRELGLHTVCEEARCPNIGECWEHQAATFMILGDVCTRNCAYCAVAHGTPAPFDPVEPVRPDGPLAAGKVAQQAAQRFVSLGDQVFVGALERHAVEAPDAQVVTAAGDHIVRADERLAHRVLRTRIVEAGQEDQGAISHVPVGVFSDGPRQRRIVRDAFIRVV